MMEQSKLEAMRDKFMQICQHHIRCSGITDLLRYMELETDFFSAPASTKYHGNYKGGLLEHSLNVYEALQKIASLFSDIVISAETIAIVALFHDLCKANYYTVSTRNVKDEATGKWSKVPFYTTDDQFPIGHGEKSVILLLRYIELTDDEIYAIRWHMSAFDNAAKGGDYGLSKAYEKCPLAVMLHLADMMASYLMESRES